MRWKVGIAGQHTVLHQLAIVVSNDDMRLEVRDDVAVLSGARLDALDDIASVQREAERIVTIMSAFARLLLGVGDSLRVVDVAEVPAPDPGDAIAASVGVALGHGRRRRHVQSSPRRGCVAAILAAAVAAAGALEPGDGAGPQPARHEPARWQPAVPDLPDCRSRRRPVGRRPLLRDVADGAAAAARGRKQRGRRRRRCGGGLAPAESTPERMTLTEARSLVDRLLMAWVGSAARHTPGLHAR